MATDILIIDDEADIRSLISDTLKDEGYATRTAHDSTSTFSSIRDRVPDAMVLDIWLKDSELDGLGILENVRQQYPFMPVIMISGHGNIETAINSIKLGAYDFIEKPFEEDKLILMIRRAIEASRLKLENAALRLKVGPDNVLIGSSGAISQLKTQTERVAPTNSRVFISGPAGSGKEVVARIIHQKSLRSKGPFVVINASSMSLENSERELFGIEGDNEFINLPKKVGLFEKADGGTLFIDEIADMPLQIQSKFLRVLQDGSLERVGGRKQVKVDFRVITATNRDIQAEIKAGNIREDLYYRLSVVPLRMPALQERREDIPLLSEYFLKRHAEISGTTVRTLSEDAIAALQAYQWPGNVRQLRNVIEWLLIMAPDDARPINSSMLPSEIFSNTPATLASIDTDIMSMPLREAREVFERKYLRAQISRFGGNISRAAQFIGMERSALHRKLRSLNLTNDNEEAIAEAS